MNHGPLLFLGVLFTMAWSWFALVFLPQKDLGNTPLNSTNTTDLTTSQPYPVGRLGAGRGGEEVYRANGCATCHTQQIRPATEGSDIARGWGIRFSVLEDLLQDDPVMPGNVRIGPDLLDAGSRLRDPNWHLLHLYNPKSTTPGSTMPRYKFLFEKRKIGRAPSAEALKVAGGDAPAEGYEIVPRPEALALTSYLLSLQTRVDLFQAPIPRSPTNAIAGGTNALAGGTNAALTNLTGAATNTPAAVPTGTTNNPGAAQPK